MGMYLMRQIGSRGVYGDPILPDFMVFLNWKELPWFWYGMDMFPVAMAMVLIVPMALLLVDRLRGQLAPAPAGPLESIALLGGGMVSTFLVFSQTHYPLMFLIQPITLLHAFRLGSLVQLTGQLVLQRHTLGLEGRQRAVFEQVDAVFDAADTLVQRLVLIGQTGKVVILLAQGMQLLTQFREVSDQRMVFYMHGAAPVITVFRLALPCGRPLDPDQCQRV